MANVPFYIVILLDKNFFILGLVMIYILIKLVYGIGRAYFNKYTLVTHHYYFSTKMVFFLTYFLYDSHSVLQHILL